MSRNTRVRRDSIQPKPNANRIKSTHKKGTSNKAQDKLFPKLIPKIKVMAKPNSMGICAEIEALTGINSAGNTVFNRSDLLADRDDIAPFMESEKASRGTRPEKTKITY